jgi:hypothetical protein
MVSILTTLLVASSLNVAEARPHHNRHHAHRHHRKPRVVRVVPRVSRPAPPPRAHGAHIVYFDPRVQGGHWVRHHRNPLLIWKWNPRTARWTVVIKL